MTRPASGNAIIDQKDIKKTIMLVVKNWYWFVLFLAITLSGSVFYLYKSTKYFGVQAKIMVKPQKNALQDAMAVNMMQGNGPGREEIANEIEVLSSSSLIGDVIGKLNLEITYFIEGRLRTGELYSGRPFTVDGKIIDGSLYGAPFNVNILNHKNYKLTVDHQGFNYQKVHKFGEPVVNDRFSFIITGDTSIIGKNNTNVSQAKYLFRIYDRTSLIGKYRKALDCQQDEEASVIKVTFEDEVPEKANAFLKALTELYIEKSVSVQKEVNENTLAFVEDQLQDVENILNGVESNLEQFQRSRTSMNPESEQGVYLTQKMGLETELVKLNTQMRAVDYLYEQLTNGTEISMISPSMLGDSPDPSLGSAFAELNTLIQRRTNLLFSNTPNSPVVKEVDASISVARQSLITSVLNMRRALAVKINSISSQLGQSQGAISQMPSTMRGLVNINRKVEINEKIYLFLLETRAKTVIEKAGIVADKYILEYPTSTGLVRPLREKVLMTGAGLGFALAFLVIFLKSVFYNFINTKEDITESSNLPVIGVVGKSKEAKSDYLIVDKFPQSLTSEAFRVIRTNLSYFSPKVNSKVALFTSFMPGEGKTFNAINTGTILAKAKKKVVLIDLDLHKPKQANAFNLKNDIGVTSFLVGKASLTEIIRETPVENLHVILTGPRTPNASELIVDPMLEDLINQLKTTYDFIILDTPPAGLLSDALNLMKLSDINIFVLKAGFTRKEAIEAANQIVEKNDIKHMVFLLNNVNQKNIPAGYGSGYYK
jgi:tyrosine-protein kinase Etk/Wzc